jgi:heme/copper-type cytochrome/quinol oxidase subunit 1
MGWIDRLNLAQRVVVVITLGLALGIVASYLTGLGLGVRTGWYAYAPLSGQLQGPGIGEPGWLRLIIWLAAVSLWSLTSLRVLSQSPGPVRLRDRP